MMQRYTLAALSQETGVTERCIRGWIQRGMVPRGDPNGRYGAYTYDHVRRILAIRDLKDNNMSNADIRDRFDPIGMEN